MGFFSTLLVLYTCVVFLTIRNIKNGDDPRHAAPKKIMAEKHSLLPVNANSRRKQRKRSSAVSRIFPEITNRTAVDVALLP
jgi:hypothetical protein